jgi:hypothetical protein
VSTARIGSVGAPRGLLCSRLVKTAGLTQSEADNAIHQVKLLTVDAESAGLRCGVHAFVTHSPRLLRLGVNHNYCTCTCVSHVKEGVWLGLAALAPLVVDGDVGRLGIAP